MITKREKQVMHCSVAYQFLTNASPPFLNPDHLPFQVTPPSLFTGHDVVWCGIPLWSVQDTHPSYAPSQFHLLVFSLAQHVRLGEKSLT